MSSYDLEFTRHHYAIKASQCKSFMAHIREMQSAQSKERDL